MFTGSRKVWSVADIFRVNKRVVHLFERKRNCLIQAWGGSFGLSSDIKLSTLLARNKNRPRALERTAVWMFVQITKNLKVERSLIANIRYHRRSTGRTYRNCLASKTVFYLFEICICMKIDHDSLTTPVNSLNTPRLTYSWNTREIINVSLSVKFVQLLETTNRSIGLQNKRLEYQGRLYNDGASGLKIWKSIFVTVRTSWNAILLKRDSERFSLSRLFGCMFFVVEQKKKKKEKRKKERRGKISSPTSVLYLLSPVRFAKISKEIQLWVDVRSLLRLFPAIRGDSREYKSSDVLFPLSRFNATLHRPAVPVLQLRMNGCASFSFSFRVISEFCHSYFPSRSSLPLLTRELIQSRVQRKTSGRTESLDIESFHRDKSSKKIRSIS